MTIYLCIALIFPFQIVINISLNYFNINMVYINTTLICNTTVVAYTHVGILIEFIQHSAHTRITRFFFYFRVDTYIMISKYIHLEVYAYYVYNIVLYWRLLYKYIVTL